jgi:tetratricopeptide (TPR) repeat protein
MACVGSVKPEISAWPNGARAAELRELGYKAYRLGNFARARQHFERALTLFRAACGDDHATTGTAYSDLGAAASAVGDQAVARACHEAALAIRRRALGNVHADVAASLHNLGAVRRIQGELSAAEACHREAVEIWRGSLGPSHQAVARGLASLGHIARLQGHWDAAVRYHREALRIRQLAAPPQVADIAAAMDDLARNYAQAGDFVAAQAQWRELVALLRRQFGDGSAHLARPLNNLGVALRNLRDVAGAEQCFAGAVEADPELVEARHNLAAILARQGRGAEARRHRDVALRRERVFVQPASEAAEFAVLILSGSDEGNVPIEHILPQQSITRVWWFVGHATKPLGEMLPPYDVVFNGIGDPDLTAPNEANIGAFLRRCGKPVMNAPEQGARTRRDVLPSVLQDLDDIVVPRVKRLTGVRDGASIVRLAAEADMALPLLLRPAGSHGGAGVIRIDAWEEFDPRALEAADVWYVSEYVDCRSEDGFVRKYRVAFVDGVTYPYHVAISEKWMVHYFSADMERHDWKLREEAVFLADWRAVIGARAADAIAAIGRRLELDFGGVDFAILPDGRAVIFEANATMLIHPESDAGPLAFKNSSVGEIVNAMRDLLRRRGGGAGTGTST